MELVLISDNKKYEIKEIKYTKKRNIKFVIERHGHKEELAAWRFRSPIDYTKTEIREIPETYELTSSSDYKERLVGEYLEVCIRHQKLLCILKQYEKGELPFELSCPYELLVEQADIMMEYMLILEKRFKIEGISHIEGRYDQYDTTEFKIPF